MMVVDSTQVDNNFPLIKDNFQAKSDSSDENSASDSPSEPLANDNEGRDGSESEEKKRGRRRVKGGKHHRKWKPYNKLSWNERRELDERETTRANQKREDAFAHGHPVAPYNTTQFLMEDHIKNEAISPDLKGEGHSFVRESSDISEDSSLSSEETEKNYMEKEFSETYNNIHAERLQLMSKDELIKDYVEIETKLERLQKRYDSKHKRRSTNSNASGSCDSLSSEDDLIDFEEAKKLEIENRRLRKENEKLKNDLKMADNNN